jgi:hypothetical protein
MQWEEIKFCLENSSANLEWTLIRIKYSNSNKTKQKITLRGLSLRANYTDRATVAFRRSYFQFLRIERHRVVSAADPHGRNLDFRDRSRYFFFQVALQLYSRGWVDPVPDQLLLRKSCSAWNRIRTSGSVGRNSEHSATEAVNLKVTGWKNGPTRPIRK